MIRLTFQQLSLGNKLMKIIFENDNGGVAVIHPTQEGLDLFTIKELAIKDVPHGKPYWIVKDSFIPDDRTFRNAWELDKVALSDPHGVGGVS